MECTSFNTEEEVYSMYRDFKDIKKGLDHYNQVSVSHRVSVVGGCARGRKGSAVGGRASG